MEIGGRFSGRLLGNSGGIFVLLFRQCLNQPSHSALVPSHEIVTLPHTTPRYPESRRPSTILCGRGGRSGFDLIHSIHEQEFSPLEC
jgi:hypothetical protein